VPLGFVQRWNAEYAGSHELSSVVLELVDGADVTRLSAAVRALGFAVADSGAERAGLAILLLTLLFALISIAIVTVAAINIAHSFFRAVAERRRELGVLRAVGASARDIYRLVLTEAAAIGLIGGALGLALARLLALALDAASRRLVPEFPFKPETYFSFDWPILIGALLCSIAACMAGALLPARAAARLEPSEALAAP
jgi:ABC-type antimicrobial peptide transport system permease subunit